MAGRERNQLLARRGEERVVINDQRARCSLGEHREGRVEIILGTGPRDYYLLT
jgi:hypothetical protein